MKDTQGKKEWADRVHVEWSVNSVGVNCPTASIWYKAVHKPHYLIEYLSAQECDALIREARAKAFRECGVCFECGEELDDLCDCAPSAPARAGESRGEKADG